MSTLTDQITTQLAQQPNTALIKNQTQGIWYTGADLLDDITLYQTSLRQQSVGAGQYLLVNHPLTAVLPVILIASWSLGINVTLTVPTTTLPNLTLDHYTAMIYPTQQTNILATQADPHQVSLLPLLLNTEPNFAYFVHDLEPAPVQAPEATLQLPGTHPAWSQADLLATIRKSPAKSPIPATADLTTSLFSLLAHLLQPTPITLDWAG